jgi:glyoxylase-like metal-dependent hydrolase (beta-lactamase superfamily II)
MMIKKENNPFTTNSYIVIDQGSAVFIDPVGDAASFAEDLEKNQATCLAIVYTHGHYDHIAAAEVFEQRFGVPVYIHTLEKEMLYIPEKNLSVYFSRNFSIEESIPVVTFQDGEELVFGSLTFKVHHTPGHTAGSVCLEQGSDLFTGDTLFEGSIGRTDFPGSDPKAMQQSLKKLKTLDPALCIHPGHGLSSTLAEEWATNPYMR